MELFTIYTYWLTLFSIGFTFLPMSMLLDWRKRGTAEGFSSIGFVLPLLMMSCWYRHGVLANDPVNIYLNGVNLAVFSFYVVAFAYYQPARKYLYGQLLTLCATVYMLYRYVETFPKHDMLMSKTTFVMIRSIDWRLYKQRIFRQAETMAAVAAFTQVLGLLGAVYDVKRAVSLKTTEYIPAPIQFGVFALSIQWLIFAIIIGNWWMAFANVAGLAVNIVTLAMYFKYPPQTWVVPLFGVGGSKKTIKKKQ